jgi:hypothetical protein
MLSMVNQSGGLGGMMDMTMRELSERSNLPESNDFENAFLGPLTIGKVMSLLQGNTDCLDEHHARIRESVNAYI